jgi:DNA-directed RNA polymerase subunit RPC12/RpoP
MISYSHIDYYVNGELACKQCVEDSIAKRGTSGIDCYDDENPNTPYKCSVCGKMVQYP